VRKCLFAAISAAILTLFSCGGADASHPEIPPDPPQMTEDEKEALFIETIIDGMSPEEQVSQLFILSLGAAPTAGAGGYVLFSGDITTVEGTKALTDNLKAASKIPPFICIDEEGGAVSRLSAAHLPGYAAQPSAGKTGASGDKRNAYLVGENIGRALSSIGVNVDFAPVADVLTNPENTVIAGRSYGSDPALVSDMVSAFQAGLHSQGVMSAPKHFPGHGGTESDPHLGASVSESGALQLAAVDYPPFIRAIGEGAEFIMVGHITVPGAEPEGLPATLSKHFISDVLRGSLGFEGIIITDAMNMGAITNKYAPSEAAVMAFKAGADMILMPEDYDQAANGMAQAVESGDIPIDRMHESLYRILHAKLKAGLIKLQQ